MSSQVPSATRYHATATGSAVAQNASSTMTYEATPAAPYSLTRANPLGSSSDDASFDASAARASSANASSSEDATNTLAAHRSVGAAIIASALSYDGSKKKSPATSGVTTHADDPTTTKDANATTDESGAPEGATASARASPPSRTFAFGVASVFASRVSSRNDARAPSSSGRRTVFSPDALSLYAANAAHAQPALPRNVRSACSGTSAFMDGGL